MGITAGNLRGHNVTLFEQSDRIGGQFNIAKIIPGKEEFYEMIRYFHKQLALLKDKGTSTISVQKNTRIDTYKQLRQITEEHKIDKWVVATGVHPRRLNNSHIEGIEDQYYDD